MACLLLPNTLSAFLKACTTNQLGLAETHYAQNECLVLHVTGISGINTEHMPCLCVIIVVSFCELTLATGPKDLLPGIRSDSLMPSSSLCM